MSLYEDYKKKEKKEKAVNSELPVSSTAPSLYDRFKANQKTSATSTTSTIEPKKNIFQKYMDLSQKGQDLSEEFYLGVVGGVSKLFQQALAVGSQTLSGNYRFTKYNAKILSMLGVPDEKNYYLNNPTKVSDIEQRIADKLEKTRTTLKANTDTNIAYLQSLNPMHDTLGGQIAGAVGSTAVFAGAGVARVPATLLAISEAAMNAEDTYDTNVKSGMDKKEAMNRSMAQFTADSVIGAITNNIGFLGKLAGGKNLINFGKGTLGKVLSTSLEILKDTSIETLQEVSQTGTANLATGRPFTEGMSQTALVSFLSSLPFGGFATLANVNELPTEEKKQIISSEIDNIKQKVESGQKLTPDESVIYTVVAGVNPIKGEIAEKQIDDNLMKQILQDSMVETPKTQEEANFIEQEKERISKLNNKEKEDEALFQRNEKTIEDKIKDIKERFKNNDAFMGYRGELGKIGVEEEGSYFNLLKKQDPELAKLTEDKGIVPIFASTNPVVGLSYKGSTAKNINQNIDNLTWQDEDGGVVGINHKIENPMVINAEGKTYAEMGLIEAYMKEAIQKGHDSLIIKNVSDIGPRTLIDGTNKEHLIGDDIVYFKPEQITKINELKDNEPQSLQKTTDTGTVSYQRGLEIIRNFQDRLGLDFPVYIYSKILTGETFQNGKLGEAYGMYLNGAITLSEFIKETTAYHEIGHLLFRNMENIPVFKGLTREKIYSELRQKYGNLSKVELEEKLMEEVEKRATEISEGKNPKTPTTFIGRLVEKIYNFFKDLFGLSPQEYRSIEKFLDRMYFGKNTEVVTLHDSGATSAFMKKRMEEFGEDIPMFEKKEETERNYPSRQEVINELNKQPKDTPAKAFVKGKKAGKIIFENKQETKDRKSELNRMRESITTRLYRLSLIDTLRKNLPRSEWGKYLKRLTEVGISESKYLNLTRVIKDASVDIMVENGDRKDRATMRSKIGYLRNVFDINPKLILSIKNYLDIRDVYQSGDKKGQKKETLKSIKDYDFTELLRFEAELQKRIEYRKNNPVSYFDYLEEPKNNVLDNIKKVSSMAIDTIERRLRNISPVLEQVFMTHYFEIDKQTNNRLDKIKSFVDAYLKAPEETQILIQKDAQNGRVEALEATLQAIGVDAKSIEETREVLDEIYKELKNVGLDIGYVKNYFPRRLKPMTPDMANLAIKIFENSQGMPATQEEKAQLTSNLLRGLSTARLPFITLSGQKFATERLVEEITDSNIGFYEDLATSLIDYIKGATQTIEQRKFFGKNFVETLDDEASLNNSIAKYVVDMVDSGQIKSKDINELRDILRTVFKPMETNLLTKFTNDYVYPIALNQFTSTLNQAKDLSLQILKDVLVGQFNLIGSQQLKPSDIFTEQSFLDLEKAIETNDKSAVAKILEKTMIPFSKADLNFLRVYINASYKRVIKLAKRGNQEFQTTLENIFGKDKAQEVIAELKTKNGTEKEISDEIKRILYSEVANIRPITKLQKTELALNEKSRMFYVLKNYMIKQIEFTRKESLDYIAKGIKTNDTKMIAKGVGRLTMILAMVSALGASIDSLKDWILGKGNEKEFIKDHMVENLFNVIGWNNYSTMVAKREGLPSQIVETYLSPSGLSIPALFANDVWKDLKDLFDGELETPRTIKKIPLIGNLLYRNL